MFLGLDIGTSAVKAVLTSDSGETLGEASADLTVSRPRPLWSEQDPRDWFTAAGDAIAALGSRHDLSSVRGLGLSGQMHGATLLDERDHPLRPAILWNDGRSERQCRELEERVADSRAITANLAMPGFTAPKLLWVREHEPQIFERVRRVLLPKDYVRLRLTGDAATDCSDASGTLWLDVGGRRWSEPMLAACGLTTSAMPRLHEGSEPTGTLRAEIASQLGLPAVPVAAGGGDQAAGAVGAGVIGPGDAFLSLGTSGVLFVSVAELRPDPERAVHSFCHALPRTWHQMAVILSAASCLAWFSQLCGTSEAELVDEVQRTCPEPSPVLFLPYLTGERTPHNDPHAVGVFFGMTAATSRAALTRAILEGVAFALADGQDALRTAGTGVSDMSVIGGGSRSQLWGSILAAALDRPLAFREGSTVGAAHGAARLARLAVTGEDPGKVCAKPSLVAEIEPRAELADAYRDRRRRFAELYRALRPVTGTGTG